MLEVDMSAEAITTRLKRVAQLRRLALSLRKAKLPVKAGKTAVNDQPVAASLKSDKAARK